MQDAYPLLQQKKSNVINRIEDIHKQLIQRKSNLFMSWVG